MRIVPVGRMALRAVPEGPSATQRHTRVSESGEGCLEEVSPEVGCGRL